jgi:uncharacterized protein YrrD
MLRSLRDLALHQVLTSDSEAGTVVDLLLPNDGWKVCYLLVETGGLRERRLVCKAPTSIEVRERSMLQLDQTPKIRAAPHGPSAAIVDTDAGLTLPGAECSHNWEFEGTNPPGDVDWRSARECLGYQICGTDAKLGRMHDFIVDDETWEVRYLVIDIRKWLFRKLVLVTAHKAIRISKRRRTICVERTRKAVRRSPAWELSAAINRAYCSRLCDRFGRAGIGPSG